MSSIENTKNIIIGEGKMRDLFRSYLEEAGVKNIILVDVEEVCCLYRVREDFPKDLRGKYGDCNVYCPLEETWRRGGILSRAHAANFRTPNFIHPKAEIDPMVREKLEARPDAGVYVFEEAVIEPDVGIGDFVLFEKKAHAAKGAKFGQAVSLGEGVDFGECSIADDNATIEKNSKIGDGLELGEGCTIGKGTSIFEDVERFATVTSHPMNP